MRAELEQSPRRCFSTAKYRRVLIYTMCGRTYIIYPEAKPQYVSSRAWCVSPAQYSYYCSVCFVLWIVIFFLLFFDLWWEYSVDCIKQIPRCHSNVEHYRCHYISWTSSSSTLRLASHAVLHYSSRIICTRRSRQMILFASYFLVKNSYIFVHLIIRYSQRPLSVRIGSYRPSQET